MSRHKHEPVLAKVKLSLPTIKLVEKLRLRAPDDKKIEDYLSEYLRRSKSAGS